MPKLFPILTLLLIYTIKVQYEQVTMQNGLFLTVNQSMLTEIEVANQ